MELELCSCATMYNIISRDGELLLLEITKL
jgi:hypothetical protein